MDEETVKRLESEIEELNNVEGSDDQDIVDGLGFRRFIKRQKEKISGKLGKKSPEALATSRSENSSPAKDFQENRTAFVSSESKHKGQDDNENTYDFTHADQGLAVIINNEGSKSNKTFGYREGSYYDQIALTHTFTKLGFEVWVYTNLTAKQMLENLKLVKRKYNLANADCFVCAILTHGGETSDEYKSKVRQDILYGIDGSTVPTRSVVKIFSDELCPGLHGKPRLFFLQACRGSKCDPGTDILVSNSASTPGLLNQKGDGDKPDHGTCVVESDNHAGGRQTSFLSSAGPPEYHQRLSDSTDAKPMSTGRVVGVVGSETGVYSSEIKMSSMRDVPVSPTPLYKDCLVMYATPPGHYAWRNPDTGSWFVQSLYNVLGYEGISRMSLTKALVIVSGQVAKYESNTPDEPESHRKMEVPVIESMLTRDVYFTRR